MAHAATAIAATLSFLDNVLPIRQVAEWIATQWPPPALWDPSGLEPQQLVRPAGYPAVAGVTVLLICALAFLSSHAVFRQRLHTVEATRAEITRRSRYVFCWFAVGVLLIIGAVGAYQWMAADRSVGVLGLVPLGALFALLVLAVPLALARRQYAGVLIGMVLLSVPLAVIAGLAGQTGVLAKIIGLGVPWLAAAVAIVALVHAAVIGLDAGPLSGARWWLVVLLAVIVALPELSTTVGTVGPGWYAANNFAFRVDSLLAVLMAGALAAGMHRAGPSSWRTSSAQRWLGIGCGFVVLAGAFSFDSTVSLSLFVAAATTWWLLPKRQLATARKLDRLSEGERRHAVTSLVLAGEARRAWSPLRKSVRDKVADRELALNTASETVAELERQASGRHRVVDGITMEERALGSLGENNPAERAKWGAVTGTVVGLPWTVLALYGIVTELPANDTYPLLSVAAKILPQLVVWTAYGALFGYFFPLLRGRTGLLKALCLFVAAAVPSVVQTVLVASGSHGWQTVALTVVQTFSFAMTLGLLADRRVLRTFGHESARLADIHNLGAVAAWASSVVLSGVTALATALIVGLQPFIIGPSQPSQPPAPPPATTAPPH